MTTLPGFRDTFPAAAAAPKCRDGWKAAQKAYLYAPRGKRTEREVALKRLTTARLLAEIAGRG